MNTKDFAEKFIKAANEAWQKGNFDALEKLEDPKVIYHIPPMPDVVGFEAHKQYILGACQAVSSLKQEWGYIAGDGNVLALSYKMNAMFTGQAPGLPPPTGKEISNDSLFVFLLKNGKIIEAWNKGTTTGLT